MRNAIKVRSNLEVKKLPFMVPYISTPPTKSAAWLLTGTEIYLPILTFSVPVKEEAKLKYIIFTTNFLIY